MVALRSCDFSCVLLISLVSCECSLHCRLGFQAHLERPRFQAHFEVTHVVPSCCSHLHYKLKRKKTMINLCTAVTQFSGVLYPCKHQAWPRDTQVNILVKWYPVSLYVSIDFLAAARNTTYRCRDPPADFASSMSYFTLMVKAALMYIYTCGQVGGTLYIVAPHKLRVD